ncbi:YbhB/YbcL family Raf kinase inhibitor-like protein [Leifsonia sp. TF02-11]|uniref:YbhB/YbcL family Raf kinase inhibitor-like protein n=1 Tax=Leifsonia sp. TF02-11 TaxID=2815212 RepID=UPI001AA0F868|nr:YbhB/YbcL family Raf kinase inhibitor-like protein [Leifsonia sp. TF02-11]MBO1739587.1 YbhB/YbcL family Raf kinase inhibitor-like protein [Leifsonia sp. TF02-11]
MPNPIGRALRDRRAGHEKVVWERDGLRAPESFTLTSPAFDGGAAIPDQYKGRLFGQDLSPALTWTTPPVATEELVLIVEDPDAPRREPAVHTIARGIDPALGGLPEGALARHTPPEGVTYGRGSLGSRGWHGPMPVPSHGPHTYVFQLFAVDRRLDLPAQFGLEDVARAMHGHVIARARLNGTYENP